MSTIIFNDASEISVQSVRCEGDYLMVLSLVEPAQLRQAFEDPVKTKKIQVKERGQIVAEYEGYTDFYRTEEYTGAIYGVVNYRPGKTPEVQETMISAAVVVAQIQAQNFTDDQALVVKDIYPNWDPNSVNYDEGYKVIEEGILYKCISSHTSQESWAPGVAPSLWAAVSDGSTSGTQDDPIPVPDTVTTSGMEYEKGKYYSENGDIYLMNRQGMDDGDTVILYFPPSVLEGQYFEKIS